MIRFTVVSCVILACVGCGHEPKPTVFESKTEHVHSHERGKMLLQDFGPYHAGLTAHLSKKDGNELDVLFETADDAHKAVPLPYTKLTGEATRAGDSTKQTLEFEPAPKNERPDDPDGKCSRFTALAHWMKRDDRLTVALKAVVDGKELTVEWKDFVPQKFAHADE